MHVVIPLKDKQSAWGDWELRFCLRSIEKYLDVDQIWIVSGLKRDWLTCNQVYCEDKGKRGDATLNKVLHACHIVQLSDDFVLMYDDTYLLGDLIPLTYQGKLDPAGNTRYANIVRKTQKHSKDGLNYDCHQPIVLNKELFKEKAIEGTLYKSLVASYMEGERVQMDDVKLRDKKDHLKFERFLEGKWCFSTSEFSFKFILDQMKEMYPDKSKWEK